MMGVLQEMANFPREISRSLRMNRTQALVFLTCWWCWTVGSMQFYLLPYTQAKVAKDLGIEPSKVAEANTTSMLSRAIGAAIFGVLSDQYGRKLPLIAALLLMGVFTLCSGFIHTYGQLVGVRFLFGITYGAIYGVNMAAVLEAVPREARGVVAGFTQQGFGAGNLLASGFHLAMDKYGWRSLYYLGAGLTLTAVALRIVCPSYSLVTENINEEQDAERPQSQGAVRSGLSFWVKFRYAIIHHWPIFIYCVVLTACFNTLGHGHMDVYPSFLESQRGLSVLHETWVTVILQCGGILGGIFGGYLSRYSAKWVPFTFAISMGPLLPSIILPKTWNTLAVCAFFFEFCYGAAIGTVGNILQMVCPHPGIRGAFGGVTYNLGNAISSIAPTIETKMGDDLPSKNGKPDYGRIILILAGIVIGLLSLTIACMPIANVNQDWDHEDPNQEVPAHEAPNKEVQHNSDDIEAAVDIEQHTVSHKNGQEQAEHIEMGQPKA